MVPYLRTLIHRVLESYNPHVGRLWVFDFDDTLVKTGSRVFLSRGDESVALTPAQFAAHAREPEDVFDFREFRELIDPRPIDRNLGLLREALDDPGSSVAIVSARSVPGPIEAFLDIMGLTGIDVNALADADPRAKADWVHRALSSGRFRELVFYDDSLRNVKAVSELSATWPTIVFRCHHVEA